MSGPTLYTIGEEFRVLEEITDTQEDATEADLDVVAKWLDELNGKLETKLERCVAYIREQEALAAAREEEAKRLRESAAAPMNRVKRLKEAIRFVLECKRVTVEPDLDAIRDVLAKGESVTFARALPRGSHLRIK